MPLKDMILLHFDANERAQTLALIAQLRVLLQPKLISLLPQERKRYGAVNEKNKKLINKVKDLIEEDPINIPAEVDWQEFHDDYQDRRFLESARSLLTSLLLEIDSTKIIHDYDNYKSSLFYYGFQVFRANVGAPSAEEKVKQLKPFFNRTGTGKKKKSNNKPPTDSSDASDTTEG
jgi:hypothetical protein